MSLMVCLHLNVNQRLSKQNFTHFTQLGRGVVSRCSCMESPHHIWILWGHHGLQGKKTRPMSWTEHNLLQTLSWLGGSRIYFFTVTGQVDNRTCVLSRALAAAEPSTYRLCHGWVVPILLAIYMLITNILLLNLLIAIFR